MYSYPSAPEFHPTRLFRRCVQCPATAPRCPDCRSDEICTTTIGDCNSCASAKCVKTTLSGSTNTNNSQSSSSGPNVAGIAGGVVGGVVGIAIVVFLIWKFWLKGRRREITQEELASYEDDLPIEKGTPKSAMQLRDARSSTHTVNSLASTVLTRASNVIQIAYIPGVTNRNPDELIPPVPPIPIPTTPSSTGTYEGENLFFVPHLRDSTFSDTSSVMTGDHRKSIASSLARSSIGTMIYQDNAIANPMPTTVVRGAAKVVSVRSGGSNNSSPAHTPAATPGEFPAAGPSGSANRPVIVRMLGSSDSLKPPVTTAKAMKPNFLTIVNNKKNSSIAEEVGSPSSSTASPSTLRSNSRFPSARPFTAISLADSIDTTRSSVMPHARARASVARSHRTLDADFSDEGEEMEDDTHERSRKSLMSKERSPFGDDAAVRSTDGLVPTPTTPKTGGKSPFEDSNAV